MADMAEISEAVETAKQAGCPDLALLHCVSGYPTPVRESNLLTLAELALCFDVVIGLSDHTLGTVSAVAAIALGAVIIEKHFTLDREDGGPDAAFSLEPQELKQLCVDGRIAWDALGKPGFERKPSEQENTVFRRSLYAVKFIPKGKMLTEENIRSIRPGFGLPPKNFPEIIGRRALVDIPLGTPLDWSLFE
jgi:N-acetylneuraminate synthase